MNNTALWNGLSAFVVTLGTALISLFSQDNVAKFSDITEVAYASALIGAVVAAFTTFKARMAPPPVPGAPNNRQGGFASPKLLVFLSLFGLALMSLKGCSVIDTVAQSEPQKPFQDCISAKPSNKTIAGCYVSIEIIANNIDALTDAGVISGEREREIMKQLRDVIGFLEFAETLVRQGNDLDAKRHIMIAQDVLSEIADFIEKEKSNV